MAGLPTLARAATGSSIHSFISPLARVAAAAGASPRVLPSAAIALTLPLGVRSLSTTTPLCKSRAKSRISRRERKLRKQSGFRIPKLDERVPLEVAWRALWAYGVASPQLPFKLDIRTSSTNAHELNVLRGRMTLPKDPSQTTDNFLILAHTDYPVGKAALRLKDEYPPGMITVLSPDLFRKVLSGEVSGYTKVLSDLQSLPAINKQLARFLGPKGLMPNTRRGTALEEPEQLKPAIAAAQGAMDWRTDRIGNVPVNVARINFTYEEVRDNLLATLLSVVQQVGASKIGTDVSNGSELVQQFNTNPAFRATSLRKLNEKIKRVTLVSAGAPGFQIHVPATFDLFVRSRVEEEYRQQVEEEYAEKMAALKEAEEQAAQTEADRA